MARALPQSSEEGRQASRMELPVRIPEAPSKHAEFLRIASRESGKAVCEPRLKSSGKVGEYSERGRVSRRGG